MNKLLLTAAMLMAMMLTLPYTAANAVDSLRGNHDLDKASKIQKKKKQLTLAGGFERSYQLQPPLIPHGIEKESINLKNNSCMKCHSAKNFEKEKAPKAGDSHYEARDGKVLTTVSSRRYFCNQCHVPQVDASPLVQNDF